MIQNSVTGEQWIVVMLTTGIVLITVVFHYKIMSMLNRWACRRMRKSVPEHYTLSMIMLGLLVAHVLEIWLFAAGHWILTRDASAAYGSVIGYDELLFLDLVYFSVTNYTTVGWGDLHAEGPLRFLAGTESLVGLMMITWSASFTYLIMSRTWRGIEDLED